MQSELSNPNHITLVLTYRCQLSCKMCGQVDAPKDAPNARTNRGNLDFEQIKKRVSNLKNLRSVYLTGGEPLLYPEFFELMSFLKSREISVAFSSNGRLLPKFAKAIVHSGTDLVSVSFDSHIASEHNSIRGKGNFEDAMLGLQSLIDEKKKAGKNTPVIKTHFTITPENYHSMEDYYVFFDSHFPDLDSIRFHFPRFATPEMGKNYVRFLEEFGETKDSYSFEGNFSNSDYSSEYEKIDTDVIFSQLENLLQKPKSTLTGPHEKWEIEQFFKQPELMPKGRSCACFRALAVQPNGDVVMCADYPDIIFGNIHESDFSDIWKSQKSVKWRENLRKNGNPGVLTKCSRLYTPVAGQPNRYSNEKPRLTGLGLGWISRVLDRLPVQKRN